MNKEKEDSEDFGFNIHYHKEDESTDNIEDYEDIPSRENWKRSDVDTIKRDFCNWIDHNIENGYKSHPEFFIKDNEKRFYMRVVEQGYTDEDLEDEGYYCIVKRFETKRVEMTDVKV